MDVIEIGGKIVPRSPYYGVTGIGREVALFADGKFVSRGAWIEASKMLRMRSSLYLRLLNEGAKVTFAVDAPFYDDLTKVGGDLDRKDLSWLGPRLDEHEFECWLNWAHYEAVKVSVSKALFGSAIEHLRSIKVRSSGIAWQLMLQTMRYLDDLAYSDCDGNERIQRGLTAVEELYPRLVEELG